MCVPSTKVFCNKKLRWGKGEKFPSSFVWGWPSPGFLARLRRWTRLSLWVDMYSGDWVLCCTVSFRRQQSGMVHSSNTGFTWDGIENMLSFHSDTAGQYELFLSCTFSHVKSLGSASNLMSCQWSGHTWMPVEKEEPGGASPCQMLDTRASVGLMLLQHGWGAKTRVIVDPLASLGTMFAECVLKQLWLTRKRLVRTLENGGYKGCWWSMPKYWMYWISLFQRLLIFDTCRKVISTFT